ncbi:hypothetical protein SGRA_1201 [Saprospira grandis str. Lewin]|uniref:Uncharacterized protein n=1 Tax=Saprospira grandis (strain Lewin) TaxID=984262 RepID=H6L4L2_SAPGL|nr:hypothetical protein SGRA_1201 [Saprospira grandis str. Lewin]
MRIFRGPRPPFIRGAAAARLRRSQGCSALQRFQRFGLALRATAAQRWAIWPCGPRGLRPLDS